MKNKLIKKIGVLAGTMLSISFAIPAFAQVTTGVNLGVSVSTNANRAALRAEVRASTTAARMQKTQGKSDTEITNRINSLNAIETRIQGMKNLSDSEKTTIAGTIQTVWQI